MKRLVPLLLALAACSHSPDVFVGVLDSDLKSLACASVNTSGLHTCIANGHAYACIRRQVEDSWHTTHGHYQCARTTELPTAEEPHDE